MKKIILLTSVFCAMMLITVPFVRQAKADDPATTSTSADCTLSASDFANLQAIENNPDLTANQELAQELALRKQLLLETISCATNDAQSLQATLQGISMSGNAAAAIQTQLLGNLTDAINFYGIEEAKVNGVGVSGAEAIAQEMLAWRTANYDPLVANINNFVLWSQNQALFTTAQNRLDQTQRVVEFIEEAAANSELQSSYNATYASLQQAQSENQAALMALSQLQPADKSLMQIQQSLQSLATTYQDFSALNSIIQTLLPTNQ
jgi:hypothetical protein